jgi:hypothetical protein
MEDGDTAVTDEGPWVPRDRLVVDEVADAGTFASLPGEAIRKGTVMLLIRDVRTGRMGYVQVPVSGT